MGGCSSGKILPVDEETVTEEKFMFFDKNLSNSSEIYYLNPGLYLSIRDIVEAMHTLIKEGHYHSKSCILVKVSRRMQKVEICLANEGSGLAITGTDQEQIFDCNVGNELGVLLKKKNPKNPNLLMTLSANTLSYTYSSGCVKFC